MKKEERDMAKGKKGEKKERRENKWRENVE